MDLHLPFWENLIERGQIVSIIPEKGAATQCGNKRNNFHTEAH